jgi:hypothetical protein
MLHEDYFFVAFLIVGLYLMVHMIYLTGGHLWRH